MQDNIYIQILTATHDADIYIFECVAGNGPES